MSARISSLLRLKCRTEAVGCARRSTFLKIFLPVPFVLFSSVSAGADTVLLTGDLGYEPQVIRHLPAGSLVDARTAVFHVANSSTLLPDADTPCDGEELPVNRYPIQIRDSENASLVGGLFAGEVPQKSAWLYTYCNSTGVLVRGSLGAVIEGLRMRRVWDAIRLTESSSGFVLRGSWVSEVRDDCIENDYLNGGLVEDMLFDGCFSGLSMRPPDGTVRSASGGAVVFSHVLMRMQSFLYKDDIEQGPPFKVDETVPQIEIHDSIIAMDDRNTVSQLRLKIGWGRIGKCSGNLLLWTADTPFPKKFARPPDCFRIVEGSEARALWQDARSNWIDCHPLIERFAEDQAPMPEACKTDGIDGQPAKSGL
ncbi:MAG: hypothetical protein ABI832_06655 [bacterium]